MAKFFSFSLFILSLLCARSQNLVPNPSFEEFENGCPANLNEMPVGWTWWLGSPNSFSTCVDPITFEDSLCWSPGTGFGYQWPASGESFVGLCTYGISVGNDYREILGAELLSPLETGLTYYISMKANLSFGGYYDMSWASNNLGMLFTHQGYYWQDNPFVLPNFAHVFSSEIIADTLGWTTISGTFVSDSNYDFVAIGNFFTNSDTDTLHVDGPTSLCSYYFVDDVCVSQNPECSSDHVSTFENEFIEVYPNPADEFVRISSHREMVDIIMYNNIGELVNRNKDHAGEVIFSTAGLSNGLYFIEIEQDKKRIGKKLVIDHGKD